MKPCGSNGDHDSSGNSGEGMAPDSRTTGAAIMPDSGPRSEKLHGAKSVAPGAVNGSKPLATKVTTW